MLNFDINDIQLTTIVLEYEVSVQRVRVSNNDVERIPRDRNMQQTIEESQSGQSASTNERLNNFHSQRYYSMHLDERSNETHDEQPKKNFFKLFFYVAIFIILLLVIYLLYEKIAKSKSTNLEENIYTTTPFSPTTNAQSETTANISTEPSIWNPISSPTPKKKKIMSLSFRCENSKINNEKNFKISL